MADMAPMKAYRGARRVRDSRDAKHTDDPNRLGERYRTEAKRLKTIIEASGADRREDRGRKEGSRADERSDRTIMGKHMRSRVSKGMC